MCVKINLKMFWILCSMLKTFCFDWNVSYVHLILKYWYSRHLTVTTRKVQRTWGIGSPRQSLLKMALSWYQSTSFNTFCGIVLDIQLKSSSVFVFAISFGFSGLDSCACSRKWARFERARSWFGAAKRRTDMSSIKSPIGPTNQS